MSSSNYNYEQRYKKLYTWFQQNDKALKLFVILYHFLPVITALFYMDLIFLVIRNAGTEMIAKVILVPLITFILVSVLRKCIDSPRPYTKYNITPLIVKEKAGESMPSRHTVSITVIAMAWLYVYPPFGCVMLVLALVLAILRVIAGVHFFKDVVAGYCMAVVMGIIGFFIC